MRFTWPDNYHIDPDSREFLRYFDESAGASVLEVGANQEHTANVLADHGYRVLGVDLQRRHQMTPPEPNYLRLCGDFVKLAEMDVFPEFDAVYSTSAIEHFGLGTYGRHEWAVDPDYDCKAMHYLHRVLKPGGACYVTVPYGKEFLVSGIDWRIYDYRNLHERIVQAFKVEVKEFFKSGEFLTMPSFETVDGVELVREDFANLNTGNPHLAVFLKLRKGKLE